MHTIMGGYGQLARRESASQGSPGLDSGRFPLGLGIPPLRFPMGLWA